MFTTNTTLSHSSGSFDTDSLPFIIDNSAIRAICNERSLFGGSFKQHVVSIQPAEGTFTKA